MLVEADMRRHPRPKARTELHAVTAVPTVPYLGLFYPGI